MVVLRSLLLAGLLPAAALAAAAEPIVLPCEVLGNELAIRAQVGGKERRIVLTTGSPYSYLKGAAEEPVEVLVGGRSLGRVRFYEPNEGLAVSGEEGGIGMDLLKGMAVGIDEYRREVTIWPKGALPASEAEAWILALPAWGGPSKVRRLKTGVLPTGSPSLEATIGGKRVSAILRLGFNGTILDPPVSRPDVPIAKNRALLPPVAVSGLAPSWLVYLPGLENTIDREAFSVSAAIAQNSLDSRRVLVDLKADAVYVEELSEDARLSRFLSSFTSASLEVRGDGLFVHIPPGADGSLEPKVVPFEGSQVLRIADVPANEWLPALRGRDEAGARRLAPLLARLFKTFRIDVLTPQGRELSITVNL
jgi:hypothetical protein